MLPAIGTGGDTPARPSDPGARALAAYDRHLAAVDAAPWRYGLEDRIDAERAAAAKTGQLLPAWALPDAERWALPRLVPDPDERAALYRDAARFRAGQAGGGRSLDTWQHNHTSNSEPDPPARPRETKTAPLGQTLERDRERVARYDRAKAELGPAIRAAAGALATLDPMAPGPAMLDSMAGRVHGCRDVRAFRDAGCGAVHAQPLSCNVRLCPDCERSRSAAYVRRLDGLAAAMARPLFGTLTLPNVPAGLLGLGVDVLLDAWARVRRTALFVGGACRSAHQDPDDRPDHAGDLPPRRARCRHAPHKAPASRACRACGHRKAAHATSGCTFDPRPCRCARDMRGGKGCRRCVHAPVLGGVAGVEVTFSPERGDWHPHLHLVADAPYLAWRELRDAWRTATCDATRAAVARGSDERPRSAGYRRPVSRPRVALARCRHLADVNGRPADRVCADGHGWRERDGERCPYQDRSSSRACAMPGEPIDPCRGASVTWLQAPKGKHGEPAGLAAVREAVKYATKGVIGKDGAIAAPIRADPLLLAELLLTLRNRRLVTGWGTFHGVTDDPDAADRPESVAVDIGLLFPVYLPKLCPSCGQEALWDPIGILRRADCLPGGAGRLIWRPPDPPASSYVS